jgi:hypothetical protein
MHPQQPPGTDQDPDHRPAPTRTGHQGRPAGSAKPGHCSPAAGTALEATTTRAPNPADPVQIRQLEKTGGWTRREQARILWYRLRLTVQEMNYATRRMTEPRMRLP